MWQIVYSVHSPCRHFHLSLEKGVFQFLLTATRRLTNLLGNSRHLPQNRDGPACEAGKQKARRKKKGRESGGRRCPGLSNPLAQPTNRLFGLGSWDQAPLLTFRATSNETAGAQGQSRRWGGGKARDEREVGSNEGEREERRGRHG